MLMKNITKIIIKNLNHTNLAITKSSLTIREPSPMNFWTNSDPETLMKVHSVWWATARASRVLPMTYKRSKENGLICVNDTTPQV